MDHICTFFSKCNLKASIFSYCDLPHYKNYFFFVIENYIYLCLSRKYGVVLWYSLPYYGAKSCLLTCSKLIKTTSSKSWGPFPCVVISSDTSKPIETYTTNFMSGHHSVLFDQGFQEIAGWDCLERHLTVIGSPSDDILYRSCI